MPIPQQEEIAQAVRRQISRLSAAAMELGVRDKITLTLEWRRPEDTAGWVEPGLSVGGAVASVNRSTEKAIEEGVVYVYRITPKFPTFSVTEHGDVSPRQR